jgi:hypothetical protein
MKVLRVIVLVCLVSAVFAYGVALAGVNEWTSLGPHGGWIDVLAIDPITPSTLYAAVDVGGVYKRADGGSETPPAERVASGGPPKGGPSLGKSRLVFL